jgi:scyllo-inositol 2-dehydrogenase (NADP+)
MEKIRVGIIGFGLSGKYFHSPLIKAHGGFQVEMVCSSRVGEVQSILPTTKMTSDPFDVINNKQLDLIINCAPNSFHYTYTAAALECGKHVVVEKPFVNTVAEGQKLIMVAKQSRKALAVFHNRRWDSDFLTVKKLIADGTLGDIKQFESHFDRWRPEFRAERWREQAVVGAGVLYDLGPHLIDQALILFGDPEEVIGDISNQKSDGLSDDYFHLILKYKKMRVLLHSSSFSNATPRFQIFGDKGNFMKYGLDPQEEQLKRGLSPLDSSYGIEDKKYFGRLLNPITNSSEDLSSERGNYLKFYENLHKYLVTGEGKIPVAATEALKSIEIIELARQSSESGESIALKGRADE